MAHNDLTVSLNSKEVDLLPEVASVTDLLAGDESCRTQLLQGFAGPASAVSSVTLGPAGGPLRPANWTSDPNVCMNPVNLFKIRGAYYFPKYGVLIDRNGQAWRSAMGQAAYITPDLQMLPCIHKADHGIVFSPPDGIETLPKAVVTMPWGALHNYGHFVCDCLPAVATLHDTPEFREGDFVFPTLKQWHREHLHLLGVAPIELTREVYYVGNAIFTNCMATFLKAPNINFRLLASIGLDAVGCGMDSSGSGVKRKIYLSRLGNDKRRFLSERDIEGALHSRGFEIVHPETLPVAEQISLFASSAVIVGCAGAGFANVIYCPPEAVVVEIKPEGLRSNTWVRNTCLLMGCRWAPYFCGNQTRERVVVIGGREREELGISFDVDQTDFLRHVDEVTGLSPGKE